MAEQSLTDYFAEVEAWRQEMDAQMRSPVPGGWLAIVGMYPLEEGQNTIGTAPGSDVLLPAGGAPEHLGVVDFKDNHGTLTVITDEVVTVDGVAVREAKLRNYYEPGGMSVVRVRDVRFGIMQWASDPYNIRVWDANAPKRLNFVGRAWYPIDTRYRVKGKLTRFPGQHHLTVTHTGGDTQTLVGIGTVDFEMFGRSYRFDAAASEKGPEYVWLLMRDTTAGKTTYGAGRFMMALTDEDGSVDMDFNKFYQPPCAFCDYTTCPTPPRTNVFDFPIEAGERYPTT
jgi:uncharacterized protein (DUF1684 family)